jgi:hypothetical protein
LGQLGTNVGSKHAAQQVAAELARGTEHGSTVSGRGCVKAGFVLLLLSLAATGVRAQGSPPMITDDTGTPGAGRWEINLGAGTELRPDITSSEGPVIDINYGIGASAQLALALPYLHESVDGADSVSGLGNSAFAVKWRFVDGRRGKLSVSVCPTLEFAIHGLSATERGLAEPGSAFLLPFQFEKDVGPLVLTWQVGRKFQPDGDAWFYGVAASRRVGEKARIGLELAGEAESDFGRSNAVTNLGFAYDLDKNSSVLLSAGRETHNHNASKATFVGYVGIQWRH